ncbi:nucleoside triphosphate pyrophosphohydrolase [Bacillus alkalicellulosilyticus]|uniref:nucleoside triphosphate pyrophosphohydrolase n=1 Tax=Alkalihalobacterium alkalicellulosilyticum TaxID=1912214 RepID=UPI000997F139|nr:nucleoside triphosphate pyrophosphohydrolase [Bacillus alkalicellulosilyticus]
MPVYNKLVRDKIPEIIAKAGKSFRTKQLTDDEFVIELQRKLKEEIDEYIGAQGHGLAIEELADILEIIHALAEVHHSSIEEIEEVREEKAKERGGFQEKIFLIDVEDE